MAELGNFDVAQFVQRHWQKEPLLVRGAVPRVAQLVDGDTLAGLACEPEVEARLVIADPGGDDWLCEDGPFDEGRFAELPEAAWTLLVQAVDQWLPEVAALGRYFEFLPRWRLDDLMVSYATKGGGVGPHFDYYDVFLLQLEGRRRWQVGQRCDADSPLREHPSLRLLADFETREDWCLAPGDMLYLPPGVAHWGTALDATCITCSIGFRAPAHAEILQAALDEVLAHLGDQRRYVDLPAALGADPFRINAAAVAAVRALWRSVDEAQLRDALALAFGRLVTEPRNPALIEPCTPDAVEKLLRWPDPERALTFAHHPASRFAYSDEGDDAVLYVDGEDYPTTAAVARGICHGRLGVAELADAAARALLRDLFERGSLMALPRAARVSDGCPSRHTLASTGTAAGRARRTRRAV